MIKIRKEMRIANIIIAMEEMKLSVIENMLIYK